MVLTRRGILSTSVLCIVGVITLPILGNLISNDLYNILQSWLDLRMRLLIVTGMIILCVFALIMEVLYQKDRRLFVRLSKDIRLLLPLFKVFKGRSYLQAWEPPDSQITQATRSGFKIAYDPLRYDPEALIIRNMLDSCREEGSGIHSLVRIHMALKVHEEQQVPDVEAALQSEYTTKSSRILHRRFEIGPQTRNVDLDVLSLQIAAAMRLAREIDEDCTLQFGSFAFLKYTDGELKWWRLHEHWTPVIYDIRRSPWNIVTGERPKWIIRGSNLQEATLNVSTSDEKEEITIEHRRKIENGEDELLCAEPGLIWRSTLKFWRGVYICAWNSASKENEELAFNLQSESRNVTRAYWISVVEGFTPNPKTLIIIIANLVILGTLGCLTHGTYSGMGSHLGSGYLGHLKLTVYGPNFKILSKLLSMFQVLFFLMEFVILARWWFTAKFSPPSGCPLPQQAGSLEAQHGRTPDLPVTDDPDLLSLVDCVVGETDKARDEIQAQEECALSRCSGPADQSIIPSVISRSSERLAQPSHHDVPLVPCTEDPVSDLEAACLNPLKKTDTNTVGKEEEEDISASGVAETTAVADSDENFSVRATTPAMIEFQSKGKGIGELEIFTQGYDLPPWLYQPKFKPKPPAPKAEDKKPTPFELKVPFCHVPSDTASSSDSSGGGSRSLGVDSPIVSLALPEMGRLRTSANCVRPEQIPEASPVHTSSDSLSHSAEWQSSGDRTFDRQTHSWSGDEPRLFSDALNYVGEAAGPDMERCWSSSSSLLTHSSSVVNAPTMLSPSVDAHQGRGGGVPLPLITTPSAFTDQKGGSGPLPRNVGDLNEAAISELIRKLQHRHPLEQEQAVVEIRRLTRVSAQNRVALCELEFLEVLLPLAQSRYSNVQINAVAAIMNLSLETENKLKVARAGAIPSLIDVLKSGHLEAQEHAAGAIFSLALNDENKMAIGVLGAIPPLIHVLRSGKHGPRRDAAMALYHLSFSQMNGHKLIKAGGVGILLGIAKDEKSDVVSRALLILCNIAALQEGRVALAEISAVQVMVGLLTRGDETEETGSVDDGEQESKVNWAEVREHAAAALLQLSHHNFRFKSQALQAGALNGLQRLAVEGTPRAREKATALLTILRDTPNEDNSSETNGSLFRRSYVRTRGGVADDKADSAQF